MATTINVLELNTANYDDHHGWMDRLPFIVETILGSGSNIPADIVCLSEIRYTHTNSFYQYAETFWKLQKIDRPSYRTDTMADMILTLLNNASPQRKWYMYTQPAMIYSSEPKTEQWEGLSIISQYQLQNTGFFPMLTSDGNDRITQYATVNIGKTSLTVYNTHFALETSQDQDDSAKLVIEKIKDDNPANFILAGDFNAVPTDPCMTRLSSHYTDLWAKYGPPNADGRTFAAALLDRRIDYIFAPSSLVNAATTIELVPPSANEVGRSKTGTIFASDHLGLWATIQLS